jgi:hypothetical protein
MLAVGVKSDHGIDALLESAAESRSQRRSLSLVWPLPEHLRSGCLGHRSRAIARSVVNHHGRQVLQRPFDDRDDPVLLVETGDDREDPPASQPSVRG